MRWTRRAPDTQATPPRTPDRLSVDNVWAQVAAETGEALPSPTYIGGGMLDWGCHAVDYMRYMLKYDTVHGRFPNTVEVAGDSIAVGGDKVKVFGERDPSRAVWKINQ